ncbi:hypothetical protein EW146_g6048 [Bondarzewia mesenterica]|uniref:Uncharacterized protein n=1 Tax=Bondarzewia mesenterica TaxID=1095465 RepID=A0A4S4LPQ7_9AGAM|nr:hypothetical protein EW146_g6048 [Bondarzewia mesenterica]
MASHQHPNVNYSTHTYLTITFNPSSPYLSDPGSLSSVHPALAHIGQVGELRDIHIYSVPNDEWNKADGTIRDALRAKQAEGVLRVDVQTPKGRTKRDEL